MFIVSWPGGSWETTLLWVGMALGAYVLTFWLALVFWTARDIRQRSGNIAAQAGAVLLVAGGFLPGHWLYLVLRPRTTRNQRYAHTLEAAALEEVLGEGEFCVGCGYPVKDEYLVCPSCRLELKSLCVSCTRPVDERWLACPYCMHGLREEAKPAVAVLSLNGTVTATAPTATVPQGQQASATAAGNPAA